MKKFQSYIPNNYALSSKIFDTKYTNRKLFKLTLIEYILCNTESAQFTMVNNVLVFSNNILPNFYFYVNNLL